MRLAAAFLVWSLPLLLCTALVVPPWANSDEPFHMLRAVHVAHGHVLGSRLWAAKGGAMVAVSGGQSDPAIYAAFEKLEALAFEPWVRLSAADLRASDAVKWRHATGFSYFANTAQYPPFFYLGDAGAYWLGRAAGLHVDATLIAARLINAMLFAAIGACALAQARRTRPLLMVVLMLPMSVALGASASQDSLLIPACALVVARIDRLIAEARAPGRVELGMLAAVLAAIGMARPPYALFTLLLLQADRSRAGLIAAGGACAAILVWCALAAAFVMAPIGASDPLAQWRFLVAHPGAIPNIIAATLAQSGTYASEFVGRLAWIDSPLPPFYLGLAALAVLLCTGGAMAGRTSRLALPWLAIVFAVVAMIVLQYLDWTPVGRPVVEGIVGRYFMPLVFVSSLGLPGFAALARMRRQAAYAAIAVLALTTPAVIMVHYADRFYIK